MENANEDKSFETLFSTVLNHIHCNFLSFSIFVVEYFVLFYFSIIIVFLWFNATIRLFNCLYFTSQNIIKWYYSCTINIFWYNAKWSNISAFFKRRGCSWHNCTRTIEWYDLLCFWGNLMLSFFCRQNKNNLVSHFFNGVNLIYDIVSEIGVVFYQFTNIFD